MVGFPSITRGWPLSIFRKPARNRCAMKPPAMLSFSMASCTNIQNCSGHWSNSGWFFMDTATPKRCCAGYGVCVPCFPMVARDVCLRHLRRVQPESGALPRLPRHQAALLCHHRTRRSGLCLGNTSPAFVGRGRRQHPRFGFLSSARFLSSRAASLRKGCRVSLRLLGRVASG